MASRALLITGATGKQGGSVINALLKANAPFEILALTRNAQSASAQKLLQKSPKIKLITGDFHSLDNVFSQAKQVASAPLWGVFSVQALGKSEEAEGKAMIDAALKHNISHFVYSSVARGPNSDTDPTPVPHFITKYNIEKHLFAKAKGSNMSYTVLRPVGFFDNLTPDFFGKVFTTSWKNSLGESDKSLQLIATSDIGQFAANAFLDASSEKYRNQTIPLVGDDLTYAELKRIFEQKTGETLPMTWSFVARIINWLSKELGVMFKWFRDVGFGTDLQAFKKEHPEMKDFGTWLETESAWKKG